MLKRYLPIRWGIAIPAVVLCVVILFVLMGPLAKSAAEYGAQAALGTKVTFSSFSLSPLTGTLSFTGLEVQDRDKPDQNLLSAEYGEGDLSLWQLLRGRGVIELLLLRGVRLNVERTEDGSFNIEKLGPPEKKPPPPTPEKKEEAKKTDWVKTIREAAEKLKKWREKVRRREKERKEGKKPAPPPKTPDVRADYVFAEEPRFVIRKIRIEDFELDLKDSSKGKELPPLTKGEVTLENVSSNPAYHDQPITFSAAGRLGRKGEQGALQLKGLLSVLRDRESLFDLSFTGQSLALTLLEPIFGLSLPVRLVQGRGDISTDLRLKEFSEIDLSPNLILNDCKFEPDGKHPRIFGIPAKDFCEAVNHVGTFEIKGLRITGELASPRFVWSEEFRQSLRKLLRDAGKQYLAGQADKYLGEGASKLKKKAEKVLGKKLGEKLGEKLGGKTSEEAKDVLKKGLKLLPGFGGGNKK